ncbi:unnamed protein product [Nesidiocoris tenuis]|uniref:Uncharacterized protein n=1 Tax=Nesidiocoris tenuis TaxID=355587 RepID=A0A6H5GS71_9HEMI|nr:unnamed protein product [Nesidiocoris tenuis]
MFYACRVTVSAHYRGSRFILLVILGSVLCGFAACSQKYRHNETSCLEKGAISHLPCYGSRPKVNLRGFSCYNMDAVILTERLQISCSKAESCRFRKARLRKKPKEKLASMVSSRPILQQLWPTCRCLRRTWEVVVDEKVQMEDTSDLTSFASLGARADLLRKLYDRVARGQPAFRGNLSHSPACMNMLARSAPLNSEQLKITNNREAQLTDKVEEISNVCGLVPTT